MMKINERETEAIKIVFPFMVKEIEKSFSIRTGFSIDEAEGMFNKLKSHEDIELNDLLVLESCLNEICYGIDSSKILSAEQMGLLESLMVRIEGFYS